jgi:hypothetical protein
MTDVVETTATVVKENKVIKNTRCRCGGFRHTRLHVASLVYIVRLALSAKMFWHSVEVVTNVGNIFF